MTAVMLAAGTTGLAAPSPEAQEACLEAAQARYAAAQSLNQQQFLKDIEPCDRPGPGEFADRCYAIGARKFAAAERLAEQLYKSEMSACLH
jgi:hypothetical protein